LGYVDGLDKDQVIKAMKDFSYKTIVDGMAHTIRTDTEPKV
jgi:hypothetical protein